MSALGRVLLAAFVVASAAGGCKQGEPSASPPSPPPSAPPAPGGGARVAATSPGQHAGTPATPEGALNEYKLKSMGTEAMVQLRMVRTLVQIYLEDSTATPRTLPPSAPLTPPAGTCCKQPGGTCAPDAGLWAHPTWKALVFSMENPFRYSYEWVSTGQAFTARAVGDLDCDGVYSTFEVAGTLDADGNVTVGEVVKKDVLE